MNKHQIKGEFNDAKGKLKEKAGSVTKDRSTQAEGLVDQVKGKAQKAAGDLKDELDRPRDESGRGDW